MDKNNPAVYECPKAKRAGMHHWWKDPNGLAMCLNCDLRLSLEHTRQVYEDTSK